MTDELVPTHTAARWLGLRRHTLTEWAAASLVAPAAIDEPGAHRWHHDQLQHQILIAARSTRDGGGRR